MNPITLLLNADPLIRQALAEDIPDEDVTTNAVMPGPCPGEVDLLAKEACSPGSTCSPGCSPS